MVEELDKAISEAQIDTKILIPEVGDMKYLFEIDSIAKTPDDIIHSMFYKDGQYSVLKFKNLFNCVAAHDYWSAYPATLLVDIRNRSNFGKCFGLAMVDCRITRRGCAHSAIAT